MKLLLYKSTQKKKCRRIIRDIGCTNVSHKGRPIKRKRVKKQKIQRKRRKTEKDEKENSSDFEFPNINPNVESRNNNNVEFSEDISDSENDDFKDKCFKELWNESFLRSLINVSYAHNCLNDFMILLRQLVSGSLPVNNIALLLCLEREKWQSLCSTAAMRFRNVTKKFWSVVYRLLNGRGIRFFLEVKIGDM